MPDDFNLLGLYDFPGPNGPGAFACPLLMDGFILIEPDAPLGTFPHQANLQGDQVPFWFVSWEEFQAAMQDGVVTRKDLEGMDPVKGVAHRYQETLRPREGNHLIVIRAQGQLEDGRNFRFQVNHHEAETRSIQLRFR